MRKSSIRNIVVGAFARMRGSGQQTGTHPALWQARQQHQVGRVVPNAPRAQTEGANYPVPTLAPQAPAPGGWRTSRPTWAYTALLFLLISAAHAEDAPVKKPPLEHYAALWQRSIFTTKDLPTPDAPTGPLFTDTLSLAGVYEINGAVVAVLVDRTSSNIMEARIGSENSAGIKIRQIEPGGTMDKTRVQLQKGDQAGWVSFDNSPAAAPAQAQPALETRPAIPARALPPSPLLPSISGRPPTSSNDVPLPPP